MASPSKIAGCLTVLAALALLLGGCGAPLLSEREVVRGIFFEKEEAGYKAVLLVADQKGTENGAGTESFRAVAGGASSPDAALRAASEMLEGEVFYGLTDLAVLPVEARWEELVDLGELLYRQAQPAPRIMLYARERGTQPLEEQAEGLYQDLRDAQRRYGLGNGLPALFAQPTECALPVWQGTGYGFGFWQKGRPAAQYSDGLTAQLSAILSGQAYRLNVRYAGGQAEIQAAASVHCQVEADGQTMLLLRLRSVRVSDLSGQDRDEEQLLQALRSQLQQDFAQLIAHVQSGGFDPLRLSLWRFARLGKTDGRAPVLVINAE